MKRVLILAALYLLPAFAHSQTTDTVFTASQVRRIAYVVDSLTRTVKHLQQVNEINENLLVKKEDMIFKLSEIAIQKDVVIDRQNQQVLLLRQNLDACTKLQKKSFFKSPQLWFGVGVGIGILPLILSK